MRYRYDIQKGIQKLKNRANTSFYLAGAAIVAMGSTLYFIPAIANASSDSVVYNNIPHPIPGNVPSVGFEATSASEFGGQLGLDGTARKNPTVTVLMSSWACKSGTWNNNNCITNPGSTFSHPITLNIYNVNTNDSVGTLITSKTDTFTMPYRPTADDGTNCNAANSTAGEWWDGTKCDNGKAFKISFDFNHVTLPDQVIVTVAYNTSDYGAQPLGDGTDCHATPQGCPYDSLNVGTYPTPSVGEALPTANDAYQSSTWSGAYCDNGTGGIGTLRLDATCWTGFLPAFKVTAEGNGGHRPAHHHPHHDDGDKDHHDKYDDRRGFYELKNT